MTAEKVAKQEFEKFTELLSATKSEIARHIYGQDHVIDLALSGVIAGGHILLVGLPGMAKTLLVNRLAHALGLNFTRVQSTPDLMPSDILGAEVLEEDDKGKRHFRLIKGPIFTQILMADEINRASPRTQSALLQAMQEKEVTIAGHTHKLAAPFHVLATQNPIEQEGTYPLPEAQLDRFIMQIDVDYPNEAAEREMLLKTAGGQNIKPKKILSAAQVLDIQNFVQNMPVGEDVANAILSLVRGLRTHDALDWAPGPRGSQSLLAAIKAKALLDGRISPSIDDVVDLALPVLKHRMEINFQSARGGITPEKIIEEQCKGL